MRRLQAVATHVTAPSQLLPAVAGGRQHKVLVANRGEIAVRICRAARELNYETVAVYAVDDAASVHVAAADEAKLLPGPPGPGAYLDVEAILQAAQQSGATAIHPGYGFLSEDAGLASRCESHGIIFVGPSADVIGLFGDKTKARALAVAQGVPVALGTSSSASSVGELRDAMQGTGLQYPVLLKAANGGGGRGIRLVESDDQLDSAFLRCASEAQGAFGRAAIFAEQYVPKAKHIEVQVLADNGGETVHLFERDCSVQVRNQKVVELAPAFGIAPLLRERITGAALTLMRAAGYRNAGTVEFLVDTGEGTTGANPLSNEAARFYFLEVNPRIQVEHTITEQVTGVDLVAAQLRIALEGRSLRQLGLVQASLQARGYALQARVSFATPAPATVVEYAEPSGVGVRVDSACYAGYRPSGLYDPLVAKVICSGGRHVTGGGDLEVDPVVDTEAFHAAIRRCMRALAEFHIGGVSTNQALLLRVLGAQHFAAGACTTVWLERVLAEAPSSLMDGAAPAHGVVTAALLRQGLAKAATATGTALGALLPEEAGDQPVVPEGGVVAPLAGAVVEVSAVVGQIVRRGQQLLVLSAMKMESVVAAPAPGRVAAVNVAERDAVQLGQVLLVLDLDGPSEADGSQEQLPDLWAPEVQELQARRRLISEMGGQERIAKHKQDGKMTCRERVGMVADEGTWREIGSLTGRFQYDPKTGKVVGLTMPANVVIGTGEVGGRPCALSADDFTVRGGSAEGSIGDKRGYIERLARDMRIPIIRMLDGNSGGGSVGLYSKGGGGGTSAQPKPSFDASRGGTYAPIAPGFHHQIRMLSEVPVVSLLLGTVVGIGAARATAAHFSAIVRGSGQLMVAGPPVVRHAAREELTKEQLGGAAVCAAAGSVDNIAESEDDAFRQAKAFLSYLPSSVWTLAPRGPTDDPPDRAEQELLSVVPRERKRFMDSRRAIELIVDRGSFFEIGNHWARNMIVGFARLHGYPVGVVSSDARFKGGALDTPAAMKLRRHADICELFHVPILNLVDMPGFLVGSEAERTAVIRHGMTVTAALYSSEVPRFTCIMRRAFGVAGQAMMTSNDGNSVGINTRVAWPSADWGSLPLEGGIEAAYGRQLRAQPDGGEAMKAELFDNMEKIRSPFRTADSFGIEDIIDPRATRAMACQWAALAYEKLRHGDQLGPRPGFFRP